MYNSYGNCQEQPQILKVYLPPPPPPKGFRAPPAGSNICPPDYSTNSGYGFPGPQQQFAPAWPPAMSPQCCPPSFSSQCCPPPYPQCSPTPFQQCSPCFPQGCQPCCQPSCYPQCSGPGLPTCPPGYELQQRVLAVERLYRGENKPLITHNGIRETRRTARPLDLRKDEYSNVSLQFCELAPSRSSSETFIEPCYSNKCCQ